MAQNCIVPANPVLPPEIIHHAISFIEDRTTLRNCCESSKILLVAAQRQLFHTVNLQHLDWSPGNSLRRLVALLNASPYIGTRVTLVLIPRHAPDDLVLSVLDKMPNLRGLSFQYFAGWSPNFSKINVLSPGLQPSVFKANIFPSTLHCSVVTSCWTRCTQATAFPTFHRLRVLILDSTRTMEMVLSPVITMAQRGCFPSLQCLHLPGTAHLDREYFPEEDLQLILDSSYSRLRCLDIDYWPLTASSLGGPYHAFQLNRFPNLVVFRLTYARSRATLDTTFPLQWLHFDAPKPHSAPPFEDPYHFRRILRPDCHQRRPGTDFDNDHSTSKLPDFSTLALPMGGARKKLLEKRRAAFQRCLPISNERGQLKFKEVDIVDAFWSLSSC
ncbi:hypothetical protein DL96DRAFT_1623376 [Flagelloscypha sp. PMI_526]|nr:hypothetical protein DL96DRAFT_1623376 [Flagelloscypha sp. PMI_526]